MSGSADGGEVRRQGRLLLDVSALLRWTGPPVGMVRAEHALAMAALQRPNTVLTCYDAQLNQFRAINAEWRDVVLEWSGAIDSHQSQPAAAGLRRLLPGRQPLVAALERVRLTTARPAVARLADLAQRALLIIRPHQFPLYDHRGARIANVPRDLVLAEDLRPGPYDTVLTGHGWFDRDPSALTALKRRLGFRYATLCYDIIPITHPQFFQHDIAKLFRDYWQGVLRIANPMIVNAACIGDDVRCFWQANGAPPPELRQCALGYDLPPLQSATATLPDGLIPGRFALFVSTIEPRKGHAMLLRVWTRLLARGIPQRENFKLVFVGRAGWMVDDVVSTLAEPSLRATVRHFVQAPQQLLDTLYERSAFCLYPSAYEGFGLPIIEAFARGKAVLASTGGALPETVGGLSPCLDPADETAWETTMAQWIETPDVVARLEAGIGDNFAHPTWAQAASRILDAAAA